MRCAVVWQRAAVCIIGGLLGICRIPANAAAPSPTFRHVELPNRLIGPRLGAITDLTGDGRPDFLVGCSTGLFVLPGDGTGRFPNWFRATNDIPSVLTLAVADFNNDGRPDVVVRTWPDASGAQTTSVLLADSSGQFHLVSDLPRHPGESDGRPDVGDFNGDGAADVLIGRYHIASAAAVSFFDTYLGHGDGSFADPVRTVFPSGVLLNAALYIGDLNNDGRSDVVTLSLPNSTLYVWIADGSGSFRPPLALSRLAISDAVAGSDPARSRDIVAGDLNGDGTVDLLVRFYYRARSSSSRSGEPREVSAIYFGDGSGHFSPPVRLAEPVDHRRFNVEQIVADVNRDGRDDIVLTGTLAFAPDYTTPSPTDVYLALGGGRFSGPVLSPATGGDFFDALEIKNGLGDVDLDGSVDLVTEGPGALSIARGDGTGHFAPAYAEGAADGSLATGAVVADFDADGNPDVAVANSGSSNVSIWLGDGAGGWSGPTSYPVGDHETPIAMVAADLNGDGAIDLATASNGGGRVGISILYGDRTGHFVLGRQLSAHVPVALAAADFDGDGSIDLAVGDNTTRRVDIFFDMAGTTRQVTLADSEEFDGDLSSLAVADFDRNGFPDIVRSSPTGSASVFLNVGRPTLSRITRVSMGVPTFSIAAGDLDGDGIPDLAAPFFSWSLLVGGVVVARGDGAGGFRAPAQYVVDRYFFARNIAIADLNGAGERAVVLDYSGLRILIADEAGNLGTPITLESYGPQLRTVALADVNRDGTLDAVRPDAVFLNLGACGDGRVDAQEECDDGNTMSCDGCSSDCRREPAVCGNGVVDSDCEQCDDGAANSDTRPGACRANCRVAHCGDAVVDPNEACDDGNVQSCDGCSATCKLDTTAACGDGIIRPDCGEQCDDGNQTAGDGCSPTCEAELIPGGGSKSTDCMTEWQVVNPLNLPLLKSGRLARKQKCRDNDPTCDFDGGVIGSCSFRVTLCGGVADAALPKCRPTAITRWQVLRPSEAAGQKSAVAAVIREKLQSAGDALLRQGPGTCAAPLSLSVALQNSATGLRSGSQLVETRATTASGQRETDTLRFTCTP